MLQISNLGLKGEGQKLNIESKIYESQIGGGEGGPTTLGHIHKICTFFVDGFPKHIQMKTFITTLKINIT